MYANEMNSRHLIDKKLQNDFLLNTVRSQKRPFTKWVKVEKGDNIDAIKLYFGFSDTKAREALGLLTEEQIYELREKTSIGGLKNTK
jgi:hypothetical protein